MPHEEDDFNLFHPEPFLDKSDTDRSRDDVELSFAWCERQRREIGFDLLDCVEAALQSIICRGEMT